MLSMYFKAHQYSIGPIGPKVRLKEQTRWRIRVVLNNVGIKVDCWLLLVTFYDMRESLCHAGIALSLFLSWNHSREDNSGVVSVQGKSTVCFYMPTSF